MTLRPVFATLLSIGNPLELAPTSTEYPLEYYRNNAVASRTLIGACVRAGVRNFVFPATAIYGRPATVPITEDIATHPISPLRHLEADD
jgi:UDP-glucose 4-epimerase